MSTRTILLALDVPEEWGDDTAGQFLKQWEGELNVRLIRTGADLAHALGVPADPPVRAPRKPVAPRKAASRTKGRGARK